MEELRYNLQLFKNFLTINDLEKIYKKIMKLENNYMAMVLSYEGLQEEINLVKSEIIKIALRNSKIDISNLNEETYYYQIKEITEKMSHLDEMEKQDIYKSFCKITSNSEEKKQIKILKLIALNSNIGVITSVKGLRK